jgi:hypothetical protein
MIIGSPQFGTVALLWLIELIGSILCRLRILPLNMRPNRTGESVPLRFVGTLLGLSLWKAHWQSGFDDTTGRMQRDHKSMGWRKRLPDVTSIKAVNPEIDISMECLTGPSRVTPSDAGRYRTCHVGRSNPGIARGTRPAGGRGTEGFEVLPLVELLGGRGTRLVVLHKRNPLVIPMVLGPYWEKVLQAFMSPVE